MTIIERCRNEMQM